MLNIKFPLIILLLLVVILFILILVYIILNKKKCKIGSTIRPTITTTIESTIDSNIESTITPVINFDVNKGVTNINKNGVTYKIYPSKYFPETDSGIVGTLPTILTGVALSGGGTRASAASLGILQSLKTANLLSRDKILLISANSGSTWTLLTSFYENINNTTPSIDDILSTDQNNPNSLISVLSLNQFNLDLTPDWWMKSVGNSFFKTYNMYQSGNLGTNGIVGLKTEDVQNLVNLFNQNYLKQSFYNNYQGIVLRDNFPIPISIQSCTNFDTLTGYFSHIKNYIPFDSSPISSGFLDITPNKIPVICPSNFTDTDCNTCATGFTGSDCQPDPNITPQKSLPTNVQYYDDFSGRIDSFAFNFDLSKKNIQRNTWDPVTMSGTSSMASGPSLVDYNKTFSLIQSFNFDNFNKNFNKNNLLSLVDGYVVDDCSIISLLYRGIEKIACCIYSGTHDLFYPYNNFIQNPNNKNGPNILDFPIIGDFVYIVYPGNINSINYQYKVGKISAIPPSRPTSLVPQNYTIDILDYDFLVSNNSQKSITISVNSDDFGHFFRKITFGDIDNLFKKNYLDNTAPTSTYRLDQYFKKAEITINNMRDRLIYSLIFNFILTGYMYHEDNCKNLKNGGKTVNILFYVLSPNVIFYNQLDTNSQEQIDKIFMFPNICTFFPYRSDCNESNCDTYCINKDDQNQLLIDSFANDKDVQKITKMEINMISQITRFISQNLIIPFLNNTFLEPNFGNYSYSRKIPINYDDFKNRSYPQICDPSNCGNEDTLLTFFINFINNLNNKFKNLPDNQTVNLNFPFIKSPFIFDINVKAENLKTLSFEITNNKIEYSQDDDGNSYISIDIRINTENVSVILKDIVSIPGLILTAKLKCLVSKNELDGTMNLDDIAITNISIDSGFFNILLWSSKIISSLLIIPLNILYNFTFEIVTILFTIIYGVLKTTGTYLYSGVEYVFERIPCYTCYRPRSEVSTIDINDIEAVQPLLTHAQEAVNDIRNNPNIYEKFLEILGKFSVFFLDLFLSFGYFLKFIIGLCIIFILVISTIPNTIISAFFKPINIKTKMKTPFKCNKCNYNTTTKPQNKRSLRQNLNLNNMQNDIRYCGGDNLVFFRTPNITWKMIDFYETNTPAIFLYKIDEKTINQDIKVLINQSDNTTISYKIIDLDDKSIYVEIVNSEYNNIKIGDRFLLDTLSNIYFNTSRNNLPIGITQNNNIFFTPKNCTDESGKDVCLTFKNDKNNCGSCGNKCTECETCCQNPITMVSSCVNLNNDRNNCGVCGRVCGDRFDCIEGRPMYSNKFTCNRNGTVNRKTGVCTCNSGWIGQNCDQQVSPIQPPPVEICQSSNEKNIITLYDDETEQSIYHDSIYLDDNCLTPKKLNTFMKPSWHIYSELYYENNYRNNFEDIIIGLLGNLSLGTTQPTDKGLFDRNRYNSQNFKIKPLSNDEKTFVIKHNYKSFVDNITYYRYKEYLSIPPTNLYIYDYNMKKTIILEISRNISNSTSVDSLGQTQVYATVSDLIVQNVSLGNNYYLVNNESPRLYIAPSYHSD